VAALKPLEHRSLSGRLALRWPSWTFGIRARLFLAALVTLSPLVAVLVFQDYYHLVAARQRADADATRFALMKAGDVDQYLMAIETQMAVLRAVVKTDSAQVAANDALIAAVLSSLPEYIDRVLAFTPGGVQLGAATRGDIIGTLPPPALQDQVADTEAGRRLVVGQPLQPAPGRPNTVLVSRALTDAADVPTVIVLALRPDRMPPLTDVRGLPRGSTVSIIDVRGPLLARSSVDAATGSVLPSAGPVVPVPPRTEIARRFDTTDDRVIGHAIADRAPWVIYVDAPAEIALTAARADFVRDLVIGSVMLALALLLAWLISERITAPIRQLTTDAAALGAGQLSRRTAVQTGGEIGVLAGAFNETAGAIERLVGSLHVTEAELRGLNAHLEQRVRDRTAQLNALNTELEAFSFSVSHDLRAPLRRIDRFGVALFEDYGDRLDDDGRLMLERLSAGCDQMSILIDDLLRLSRVSRTELNYQRVDLVAIASGIVAELHQAHPDHAVQVVMPDNLIVHGDASLLRVVLQNLFANAWKFTRGRPAPQIDLGSVTQDDTPAVYLRDNGVGFDPAQTEKLFRAFQRLHDVRDFEGTGVGLATVQRIIHRHGGRVWAEGTLGVGATFWFTLPDWLEGRQTASPQRSES
jgi:signal transduction histidine kinase